MLCRVMHQLAKNVVNQNKLREEIKGAREERGNTDFDYDTLMYGGLSGGLFLAHEF